MNIFKANFLVEFVESKFNKKDRLIAEHQCWQENTVGIKHVIQELALSYQNAKGLFPLVRYGEMKNMIKQAIEQYRQLDEHITTEQLGLGQGKDNRDSDEELGGLAGIIVRAQQIQEEERLEQYYSGTVINKSEFCDIYECCKTL